MTGRRREGGERRMTMEGLDWREGGREVENSDCGESEMRNVDVPKDFRVSCLAVHRALSKVIFGGKHCK